MEVAPSNLHPMDSASTIPTADHATAAHLMSTEASNGCSSFNKKFELLFSSPYVWKANKLCAFFNKTFNCLKLRYKKENLGRSINITPKHIINFRARLEKLARKNPILSDGRAWKDVVGPEAFRLMTSHENQIQLSKWDTTSILSLMQVIRNLHQHNDVGSDPILDWFSEYNTKKQDFDEWRYANYWIDKFPHLACFLWKRLRSKSNQFRQFYPRSLDTSREDFFLGLTDFVSLLNQACKEQLDEGFLEARFKVSLDSSNFRIVEIRTLPMELLVRILNESDYMKLTICSNSIRLQWDSDVMEWMTVPKGETKRLKFWGEEDLCSLLFVNDVNTFNPNTILENCDKKLIIFTVEKSLLELQEMIKSLNQFKDYPLVWDDISYPKRKKIEDGNEFVFSVQSKEANVKSLSSEFVQVWKSTLSLLQGESLNELLRTNHLKILRKYELPKCIHIYIDRKINDCEIFDSKLLHQAKPGTIVLILSTFAEFTKYFSPNFKAIKLDHANIKDILDPYSSTHQVSYVVVVEENMYLSTLCFLLELKKSDRKKTFHLLQQRQRSLHWLESFGALGEDSITNYVAKTGNVMDENNFVENLNTFSTKRYIFIVDNPGMGKTQTLFKLAAQLNSKGFGKIVLYFSMNDILEKFISLFGLGRLVEKNEIILAISCLSLDIYENFEAEVFRLWLAQMNPNAIQFEIFIDALDEVHNFPTAFAFGVLEILNNKFPCVRLWVASRAHLAPIVQSKFHTLGYKMEPLTPEERINYLLMYWTKDINATCQNNETIENLKQFATRCVMIRICNEDVEVAGIPLQLWMIAEIYKERALSLDLDNMHASQNIKLMDLYKGMFHHKLKIYLSQKKRIFIQNSQDSTLSEIPEESHIFEALKQDLENSHTYFAIKLLFSESWAQKFRGHFQISEQNFRRKESVVLDQGIITNNNPLTFVHRTFAEYLVARFIYKYVEIFFHNHSELADLDGVFFKFMCEALFSIRDQDRSMIFHLMTICYFFNELWKEKYPIEHIVTSKKVSLLMSLNPNCQQAFKDINIYEYGVNVWGIAVAMQHGFNSILALYMTDKVSMLQLFIVGLSFHIFELIVFMIFELNIDPNCWQELPNFDPHDAKYGVFHWLCACPCTFNLPYEKIENLKAIAKYMLQKTPTLLEHKDIQGLTALLRLVKSLDIDNIERWYSMCQFLVEELGANINVCDNNNDNILHLLGSAYFGWSWEYCLEPFVPKIFFNAINLLIQNGLDHSFFNTLNSNGLTPLLLLCDQLVNQGKKSEEFYAENWTEKPMLDGFFSSEDNSLEATLKIFRDFGANFNARYEDGKSILHKFIEAKYDSCFILKLLSFGLDVCATNKYGKCALHLAVEKTITSW